MRVAFVGGRGYHSNYGGVENAIREVSTRLAADQSLQVDVYGQGSESWFSRHELQPGLTQIGAPRWLSRGQGNAVLAFANCLYALLWRRPRVLLLFASGPSLLAVFAKLLGVRVIAALRAIDSQRDKWGFLSASLLRMGEFSALHIADECTVNSLEMYQHYQGESRGLHYIPNGATQPLAGSDSVLTELGLQSGQYVLFAARLDPVKRLHLLLQAHRQISPDQRLPLVIAGGNCKSMEYQQQLHELATDDVQFIGHVNKERLDPLMRHCGLFVLPSVLEGMSNSLLAAMISGRSVLCADVPANRDVVQGDEETLFKADDVQALQQQLLSFSLDPTKRASCGVRMAQLAQHHYSWDATSNSYHQLIRRVAGTRTGRNSVAVGK